jgi:secreted PhoX family phosphatase
MTRAGNRRLLPKPTSTGGTNGPASPWARWWNDANGTDSAATLQFSPMSCPDNLAFDSRGNLWIATDGAPAASAPTNGLTVTLRGPQRRRVEQFLSVPRDAESCGPVIDDEDRMVFVNVQHPGEEGTFAEQHSWFPDYVAEGATPAPGTWRGPRPSVVQVFDERCR